MYGDDDLDSVLFGGSDSPGDGGFDPFTEGIGGDESTSDGPDGDDDSFQRNDDSIGVIRYGRFGGQDPGGITPTDNGPLPWAGGTNPSAAELRTERTREATSAGNRYVGRVADERSGGNPAGLRRTASTGVADSIAAAQQRIREQSREPLTGPESVAAVKADEAGETKKITRSYEKQSILAPPTFKSTNFEATIMGLKANTAGDWIIQLRVPPDFRESVTCLGDAYGLALDVVIVKRNFRPNAED